MPKSNPLSWFQVAIVFVLTFGFVQAQQNVDHVILIVVDGLRPSDMMASGNNNFAWLRQNGACTMNARHDPNTAQTLPNHIDMFTGETVAEHGYRQDSDNGSRLYMDNIFDLAKAYGKSTAFYGSKDKFDIFPRSWQIDNYVYNSKAAQLVPRALAEIKQNRYGFTYLHLRDPDRAGHKFGGGATSQYREAVTTSDGYLGQVLNLIYTDPVLKGSTSIIVTADHGFSDNGNHADENHYKNYQIPFCTWGPGVKAGADLIALNEPRGFVENPHGSSGAAMRVIRNSYAASVAANWLGLQPQGRGMNGQYLSFKEDTLPTPIPTFAPSQSPTFAPSGSPAITIARPIQHFSPVTAPSKFAMPTRQAPPTPAPGSAGTTTYQQQRSIDVYMLEAASISKNLPDKNYDYADLKFLVLSMSPRLDAVMRFELPPDVYENEIIDVTLEAKTWAGVDPVGSRVWLGRSNDWDTSTITWNNAPGYDNARLVGSLEKAPEEGICRANLGRLIAIDGFIVLFISFGLAEGYSALSSDVKLTITLG